MFALEVGPLSGHMIPCQSAHGWTMSSSSSNESLKLFLGANFSTKPPISCCPRSMLSCWASSNRRNVVFSRQNKGSSRSRTRQNQERGNPEKLEDNPPKNGPLISFPSDQRYSATSSPGPREKEIVELFKKVQAQLRVRAAAKEEKKVVAAHQGLGERGTVDSLLQLLRKHSAAQGKRSVGGDGLDPNQPESADSIEEPHRTDPLEEEDDSSFFELEPSHVHVPSSRPASSFKRRSPVPPAKFQPFFSAKEVGGSSPKPQEKMVGAKPKLELELELELESMEESLSMTKLEPLDDDEGSVDASDSDEAELGRFEPSAVQSEDLSSRKVSELRALAKTRGIRGYSKLKKNELLELLIVETT